MHTSPIAALVIGPTTATSNSVAAEFARFSMRARPPSANSVIDRTGRSRALATSAWESSCASRAAKNKVAVSSAPPHTTPPVHSGLVPRKWLTSDSVISAARMNQL
jgi:hypothetical protein